MFRSICLSNTVITSFKKHFLMPLFLLLLYYFFCCFYIASFIASIFFLLRDESQDFVNGIFCCYLSPSSVCEHWPGIITSSTAVHVVVVGPELRTHVTNAAQAKNRGLKSGSPLLPDFYYSPNFLLYFIDKLFSLRNF